MDGYEDASDILGYTPALTAKPLHERFTLMSEFCHIGQKAPRLKPKIRHHHYPGEDRLFCQLVDAMSKCAEKHDCDTCPRQRGCNWQFAQWVNRSTIHRLTDEEYQKFKENFERIQPALDRGIDVSD